MIKYAMQGLNMIFKEGYEYMKRKGIIATDLITEKVVQQHLFDHANRGKK